MALAYSLNSHVFGWKRNWDVVILLWYIAFEKFTLDLLFSILAIIAGSYNVQTCKQIVLWLGGFLGRQNFAFRLGLFFDELSLNQPLLFFFLFNDLLLLLLLRLFLLIKYLVLGLDILLLCIGFWYIFRHILSLNYIWLFVLSMAISRMLILFLLWHLYNQLRLLLFFGCSLLRKISLAIAFIVIIALLRVHRFFLFFLSLLLKWGLRCNCRILLLHWLCLGFDRNFSRIPVLNDLRLSDSILYLHFCFPLRSLRMLWLLSRKLNLFFLFRRIERLCRRFFSFPFILRIFRIGLLFIRFLI